MNTNDGAIDFDLIINDDQFNRVIEESRRRIAGLSRSTVSEGKIIDKTFAGLGKSALGLVGPATAVAAAFKFKQLAQEAYDFEKAYGMAMREVQTISTAVQNDLEGVSNRIIDLAANNRDNAIKLAKAYYQIVSAGYDGEEGLKLLEVSAKAATAGITDTVIAADGLTTVLNAWGISGDKAQKVADVMFKTVERGKTTFGELASSIAQVAPLAASNNIAFEQIFAALQTISKQGTPTAQAMTQIRSSIINMNKVLGDGWSKTMTYQKGLERIYEMAGGSQNKLKELIPDVEGVNAVLALTGEKAIGAADDLNETNKAIGSMEKAYGRMMDEASNKWSVVHNKWTRELREFGKAAKSASSDVADLLDVLLTDTKADIIDPGAEKIVSNVATKIADITGKDGKLAAIIEKINDLRSTRIENIQPHIAGLKKQQPGWLQRTVESFNAGLGLGPMFTSGRTKQAELQYYNNQFDISKQAEQGLLDLYAKVSNESDRTRKKQETKIRTLKDMLADLKDLQDQLGAGTAKNDISLLARIQAIQQEVKNYYDKIREARKVNAPEKATLISGKGTLGNYQAITQEQAKQEFQGEKLLKNHEKETAEARKKNKEIEKQNLKYLKQVKIVEGLTEGFDATSEILGSLSYAIREFDSDLGQSLEKMAELAANASSLVTNISTGNIVGAVASGIGVLGDLFAILKGNDKSVLEATNEQIAKTNESLELQKRLLDILKGSDYYKAASDRLKEINKELDIYNNKLADIKVFDARRGHTQQDTSKWTYDDWVKAVNNDGLSGFNKDEVKAVLDEIFNLKQEYTSLTSEIYNTILGFDSNSVANTILSGVQDGLQLSLDSLGDWTSSFGDLIKKALTQNILESLDTKYLTNFMEQFNKSMDDGALSTDERKNLEELYKQAVEAANADYAAIKPILDKYGSNISDSQYEGAVKGITSDEAGVIAGQLNAVRVDIKSIINIITLHHNVLNSSLDNLMKIEKNTRYNSELEPIREQLEEMNGTLRKGLL